MTELLVPNESNQDLAEVFNRTIAGLSLEGCEGRINPLTGFFEFMAPEGKAFKTRGEFVLDSEQVDIADWGVPRNSAALEERLGNEVYYDVMEDTYLGYDRSEDLAPSEFIGQSLTISVNGIHLGTKFNRGDGWRKHYIGARYSVEEPPIIQAHVFGRPDVWYEPGLKDIVWQKGNEVRSYGMDLYSVPFAFLHWRIPKASALIEDFELCLVPVEERDKNLQIVQMTDYDKRFWVAGEDKGSGRFSSDRELWVMEGEECQVKGLDLDKLVRDAFQWTEKPPSYSEAKRLQEEHIRQKHRNNKAEELKRKLVVVSSGITLREVVSLGLDGWLERELESYDKAHGAIADF